MEEPLKYLDESLNKLEEKAQEYLICEEKLRYAEVEQESKTHSFSPENQASSNPAEGGQDLGSAQLQQGQPVVKTTQDTESPEKLKERISQLKKEVIDLLPEKNKFIAVDLGYGPSSIGAFPNKENPDELDLIIVH